MAKLLLNGDVIRQTFNKRVPINVFLNGPIPASFCIFSFFSHYNFNTNWKSIDGALGIQTRGRRMVGADETTERRVPINVVLRLTSQSDDFIQWCHTIGIWCLDNTSNLFDCNTSAVKLQIDFDAWFEAQNEFEPENLCETSCKGYT